MYLLYGHKYLLNQTVNIAIVHATRVISIVKKVNA